MPIESMSLVEVEVTMVKLRERQKMLQQGSKVAERKISTCFTGGNG